MLDLLIQCVWNPSTFRPVQLIRTPQMGHFQQPVRLAAIPGSLGASILRRDLANGVELLIATNLVSTDAICAFGGYDAEGAAVPSKAQGMKVEYDIRARHVSE